MQTTLQEGMSRDSAERDRRMFERMIESFSKRWRPTGPYDGAEFDSEFLSIVRQIYTDAQAPLLDYISKLAMAMPIFPTLPDRMIK